MRRIKLFITIFLLSISIFASDKKVLIEVFTNSHCPLCPSAHSTIDNYLNNGTYKNNIVYIYYHTTFPYPDDKLSQDNTTDPAARNNFYGPFSSTPRGIFNGQVQSNNYSSWSGILDSHASQQSPFTLSLSGGLNSNSLTINAKINQVEQGSYSNLSLFIIAVETVNYQGRNGIVTHKNVMRKIFPNPNGRTFTISANQEVLLSEIAALNSQWNRSQLGFVVFVQNTQNKTVYQSGYISYNALINTDVETNNEAIPSDISLSQNYPNPFNPTTVISYQLPVSGYVTLKVYDILGREVATLVNENKQAGFYNSQFSILNSKLSSGVYFYTLRVKNSSDKPGSEFKQTKKMVLLK